MVNFSRLFAFVLLTVTICSSSLRLTPNAQAIPACDDKCRERFDFYECGATMNACYKSDRQTCLWCSGANGLCDNNPSGYTALKQTCTTNPPFGKVTAQVFFYDGCDPICPCNTNRFAEAKGNGSTNSQTMTIAVCIN